MVRKVAKEIFTTFIPALLIAFVINVYIAEAALVEDGPSMQPNLFRGDRVMMEKISYRLHGPTRGDIVVVDRPGDEIDLIKRVVGLPGERLEVVDGHTFINGMRIEEPWVVNFGGPDYPEIQIPDGHVFVLGDNRTSSFDSRAIGPVSQEDLIGRVWIIYWPLEEFRLLR